MADSGYVTPTGKIVVRGEPPIQIEKNVGTVANCYPGRLVVKETTDYDIKVADGVAPPVGFLGFEHTSENDRPDTPATIYVVDKKAKVLSGGAFAIQGKLAAGFAVNMGDKLFSWGAGCVAPGIMLAGLPALRVGFVQNASVKDTGIDVPGGIVIKDCIVNVTTEVASGTIDVGFLNAGESGDQDGLLDGESCAAAGWVAHNLVDATDANNTLGAYLYEVAIKDATGTPVYYRVPKVPGYATDGTIKSLVYTTSAHAIVGDFYLVVASPGIVEVGKAGVSLAASASAQDIIIEAVI